MRFRELRVQDRGEDSVRTVAREAAARLRDGEILVHPTSTLYGMGGRAWRQLDDVIAEIKGRPVGTPFVRLASDATQVKLLLPTVAWDERAERLSRSFWPGALTIVFEDGSPEGLAVRVDAHPLIRAVLSYYGGLISSTSVNQSGEPPAAEPEAVRRTLQQFLDASVSVTFLNAGAIPATAPSTIISLRDQQVRLIREGSLPVERVEACTGEKMSR